MKTISKYFFFVILVTLPAAAGSACSWLPSKRPVAKPEKHETLPRRFQRPGIKGSLQSSDITESSGLAASRCNEGVLWTHNDSGTGAYIYAVGEKGENLGTWKVRGAKNVDWEDLAAVKNGSGECYLYIGDIGDNARKRSLHVIYRVKEPALTGNETRSRKARPLLTEKAVAIRFRYPDKPEDAEALLIHPSTLDLYVLTKPYGGPSTVFKLSARKMTRGGRRIHTLEKVGSVSVPAVPNGFLTGGDISSGGRNVVITDYFNGYELALPPDEEDFDMIWRQEPMKIDLGFRDQGEAVCYSVDGMSVFATSEKRNSPLIEARRIPVKKGQGSKGDG